MERTEWIDLKRVHCERIGETVALQARRVFPAEHLPDQPGRIVAHRCSQGLSCNAYDRPACCWAGSWPGYDPFA